MSKLVIAKREVQKGRARYGVRVGRNAARSFVTITDLDGTAPFTVGENDDPCTEHASTTVTLEVHTDDQRRALASVLRSAAALLDRKEPERDGRRPVRHG